MDILTITMIAVIMIVMIIIITLSIYNVYGDKWQFEWWLSKYKIRKDWGIKLNIPYMVDFYDRSKGEPKNIYETPVVRKSLYGITGKIDEIESEWGQYVRVHIFNDNIVNKYITLKWDWIKKNPDFIVLSHQKLTKKVKKLKVKKTHMPRIIRFAFWAGLLDIFFQFVKNIQPITAFLVSQFIK